LLEDEGQQTGETLKLSGKRRRRMTNAFSHLALSQPQPRRPERTDLAIGQASENVAAAARMPSSLEVERDFKVLGKQRGGNFQVVGRPLSPDFLDNFDTMLREIVGKCADKVLG